MKSSEKLSDLVTKEELYDLYINQELSTAKIAKLYNCSPHCVSMQLKRYNIEARKFRNPYGRPKTGKILSCTWVSIKKHSYCKSKKKDFCITKDYAYDLFLKQNGKCALTGLDIPLAQTAQEEYDRKRIASLDRIDSSKGYIEGNVQWIHKHVNIMKLNFDQEYFINQCKYVSDWNNLTDFGFKRKFSKKSHFPEINHKSNKSSKRIGYITGSIYSQISSTPRQFNLTKEFLNDLIIKQEFRCAISGQKITMPQSRKELRDCGRTASLDRIDSSKDYEENNVWFVHKHINSMKWDTGIDDFIYWCYLVAIHN